MYIPINIIEKNEVCYFSNDVPEFWHSDMLISDFDAVTTPSGDYIFNMNIYNQASNIGALEVYDAYGNQIKSVMISPHRGANITSIKDNVVMAVEMYKELWAWTWDSPKSVAWSTKTPVESLPVPKNGSVRISNDMGNNSVLLYNCVEIAVSLIAKSVSISLGNQSDTIKAEVAEGINVKLNNELKSIIANEKKVNSAISAIIKEMNKKTSYLNTMSILSSFEDLLSTLSIDFPSILKSVATKYGVGQLENIVLKSLGAYGEVVDVLYKVSAGINLIGLISDCYKKVDSGYASIYAHQSGDTRVSNGIKAESSFDVQTILRTFVVTHGEAYDALVKTQEELNLDSIKLYDITLVRDGKEIQPTSTVTVYIPIPVGWSTENLNVYRMIYDGGDYKAFQYIKANIVDGYLVYETDHFSYYVIVNGELPSAAAKYVHLFRWETKYEATFWNWFKFIVLFGWIWMWFI